MSDLVYTMHDLRLGTAAGSSADTCNTVGCSVGWSAGSDGPDAAAGADGGVRGAALMGSDTSVHTIANDTMRCNMTVAEEPI